MDTTRRWLAGGALVAVALAASAYAYPQLPERMVTHWNAAGQANDTMPRLWGALLLPAVAAGLLALFAVVPRIDPLGENVEAFRDYYDGFVLLLTAFLAYVHLLVLAWNLGYEFGVGRALAPALAALIYAVGVVLDHAERNWFVGLRTPWTLSSDEVWDRTHRLGARLFKLVAVVSLVGGLATGRLVLFLAAPLAAVALVTTVYSYYVYRQLNGESGDVAPQ